MTQYQDKRLKAKDQFIIYNQSEKFYSPSDKQIKSLYYWFKHIGLKLPRKVPNTFLYEGLILESETSVYKWWRAVLEREYHCRIQDLIDGNDLTLSRFLHTDGRKNNEYGHLETWIREVAQCDLYECYKKDIEPETPVYSK